MRNFLPFVRHSTVRLPLRSAGSVAKPTRAFTTLTDLGTGGFIKAHLQDAIIVIDPATDAGAASSKQLKMRFGIHGAPYFTEGFYDVRAYEDGSFPTFPVWNWKKPYRIYPKQFLRARLGTCGGVADSRESWPVAGVMLNGVRVKDGDPVMIYDVESVEDGISRIKDLDVGLNDIQMECPIDSPVDLYSLTLNRVEGSQLGMAYPRFFELYDHDDRLICQKRDARGWVQLRSAPITLGEDFILDPGETITFEFQPLEYDVRSEPAVLVEVFVRGVLEVEDGR